MQKCRQLKLGRLPKGKALRSVKFRGTTPGDPFRIWNTRPTHLVDPTHPAARLPKRSLLSLLPSYTHTAFSVRALPKALLDSGDRPFRVAPPTGDDAKVVTMSAPMIVGKKAVYKDAYIRRKIMRKVKFALGLVVAKGAEGARVRTASGKEKDVLVQGETDRRLVLQDWSYVFSPSLEVYRMPYETLVPALRDALIKIRSRALVLEETRWGQDKQERRPQASAEKCNAPRRNGSQLNRRP
ncbi:hypothetical protein GLOTRDRAFT_101765 [Gloeophyllum trabeum ATCC 11539]|uniref:Uncharacterized protein n=1 Tax=Gloeophyllum trabeum (strain ATCC 11539 / FP-39264 / Madison 617) TaxID=670483 RepID=S7RDP3_GLOTA|nr:uncharacterized protein GLOTRDRAFT_101765 [Gloeophyllum trabeum ATCC 11539]EPQ50549.1 hypothetical protein GLOTRDRAFT_101765 [Gloeophyllum trabeum ATCC 11539]